MNNEQNKVLQQSFIEVAKELTTLAFQNAVDTIDKSYGRSGAAIQNPAVLAALISSNQDIYNNLAKEFSDRSAHSSNDSANQLRIISDRNDELEEANRVLKEQANTYLRSCKEQNNVTIADLKEQLGGSLFQVQHLRVKVVIAGNKLEEAYSTNKELSKECTGLKKNLRASEIKYGTLKHTKIKLFNENKQLQAQVNKGVEQLQDKYIEVEKRNEN